MADGERHTFTVCPSIITYPERPFMRKHQFVKTNCNCLRNATYLKCKFCGTVEYCSTREIRALTMEQATCASPEAPEVPRSEVFKSKLGGTFDCLSPDYETWEKEHGRCTAPNCD